MLQPLRWLRADADTLKHVDYAYKARNLYERMDACLGCGVRLHWVRTKLWRPCGLPVLPGYHRGT